MRVFSPQKEALSGHSGDMGWCLRGGCPGAGPIEIWGACGPGNPCWDGVFLFPWWPGPAHPASGSRMPQNFQSVAKCRAVQSSTENPVSGTYSRTLDKLPSCWVFNTYKIGLRLLVGSCERKCDTCQELTDYYSWLWVSALAVHLRSPSWWRKGEWLGSAHWSSELTAVTSNTLARGGLLAAWGASLCSLLQRICPGAPLERVEGAHCLSSVQALPLTTCMTSGEPLALHLPQFPDSFGNWWGPALLTSHDVCRQMCKFHYKNTTGYLTTENESEGGRSCPLFLPSFH